VSYHTLAFIVAIVPDLNVRIELVQESLTYEEGRLLAWFESPARDFLYPYPSYSASYGTHDRELLLERTLAFPVCLSKLFVEVLLQYIDSMSLIIIIIILFVQIFWFSIIVVCRHKLIWY